jgi:hypothetical protein
MISRVLADPQSESVARSVRAEVLDLCRAFPLPYRPLGAPAAQGL